MTSLQGLLGVLQRSAARRPRLLTLLGSLKRLARGSLYPIEPLVHPGVKIARRWRAARHFGGRIGAQEILPSDADLHLFASQCAVQIAKARRLLGYEPVFSLERGMELTTAYVRWAPGHRCPGREIPGLAPHTTAAGSHPTPRSLVTMDRRSPDGGDYGR